MIFNNWTFIYWILMGVGHALVVFIVPLFIFQENILNRDADNSDLWSFSVTSFTCVIMIVTLKLMINSKYMTWINLVSIFFLSLGIYFIYVWASNYTGFSLTYMSIPTIWSSAHFYLTVIVCVTFCYIIDMFITSFQFEITAGPGDFLRKLIANGKSINTHAEEFQNIYGKIKTRYVDVDIEREVKVEEKRDLKVNKYGPNKFKDTKKKTEKKKGPKNEIELEFLA